MLCRLQYGIPLKCCSMYGVDRYRTLARPTLLTGVDWVVRTQAPGQFSLRTGAPPRTPTSLNITHLEKFPYPRLPQHDFYFLLNFTLLWFLYFVCLRGDICLNGEGLMGHVSRGQVFYLRRQLRRRLRSMKHRLFFSSSTSVLWISGFSWKIIIIIIARRYL